MSGWLRLLLVLAAMPGAAVSRAGEPQPPVDVASVADRVLAAQPGDSLLLVIGDRITSARIALVARSDVELAALFTALLSR